METTDKDSAKLEIIRWISSLEDESVISKIMEIKDNKKSDFRKELSEAEKKSIETGIQDAQNGKLHPNESAKMIYGKWL